MKEIFDEIQELILIVGALGIWVAFEYFCFKSEAFGSGSQAGATRTAIITIVTNVFTYIFTKSRPKGETKGER